MDRRSSGRPCAGTTQVLRSLGDLRSGTRIRVLAALAGVVLGLAPAAATAARVVIRFNSVAPIDLDFFSPFGGTALVQEHVRIRPIVGPGIVAFLAPWDVTNEGRIFVRGSVHDGIGLFEGGSVTNLSTGHIEGGSDGVFITSCSCTPAEVDNAGRIRGRHGHGVELDVGGSVVNSGVIEGAQSGVFVRGDDAAVTNSGTISGGDGVFLQENGNVWNQLGGMIVGSDVGLTVLDDAVILNNGRIAGGALAIQLGAGDDQLTLGTGSVLDGGVDGSGGSDLISLNGQGTEDASFQNFEALWMQGTDWVLGGNSTFNTLTVQSGVLEVTGSLVATTTVEGGNLKVNGMLTGDTMVNPAGTLSGSGVITGMVVNQGTVAPGNSIGTLHVNGDFTSEAGSRYEVELNGAGQSDLIAATGTSTLNGGTVFVTADDRSTGAGIDYTILTAAGGVTGTFAGLVENFPFLDHRLVYQPTAVLLQGFRNDAEFSQVALCPNQYQAALGLEAAEDDVSSSADMDRVVSEMVGQPSIASAQSFLNEASGASRPDVDYVNLQSMRAFQDAVTSRSAGLNLDKKTPGIGFAATGGNLTGSGLEAGSAATLAQLAAAPVSAAPADGGTGGWLRGIGLFGDRRGTSCPGRGYRYDLGGAAVGIDRALTEAFAVGGAFATGYSTTNVQELDDHLRALHTHGALYGAWTPGYDRDFRVNGAFTAGWIGNDTSRSIMTRSFSRQALGDFGSLAISGALETSVIAASPGGFAIRPRATLRYFYLGDDGYTETNADALDLVVQDHDVNSLRSEIGVHVVRRFEAGGGWSLEPAVEALWSYEYLSVSQDIGARFSGSPVSNFEIIGVRPERNRALLAAGTVARMNESLVLSARYLADLAGDETVQSVQAGARIEW
jgi:outer membrane autotransporter protein